jgi:gliding motility-associated-like protein
MNRFVLAILLFSPYTIDAQCSLSDSINSSGHCPGAVLTAGTPCQSIAKIVWYNNNVPVNTVIGTIGPTILTVAGGNGYGSAANQLSRTFEIFVDGGGNIYVSDLNNSRVQKWAPCATSGVTVAGGNGYGFQLNQLADPEGLWVDRSGNVYVCDGGCRVQKWVPGATAGITVAGSVVTGSGPNQLLFADEIFMDAAGNLYISDNGNSRIQKYAPGATTGISVAGGNGMGSAANQLNSPAGIFVDASGNMYVSDQGNNRVQMWAPGATSGITVIPNNGYGSAPNQLYAPGNLWMDNAGNIYVTDIENARVQKWAPGATSGVTVAGGNGVGLAPDQLNMPMNVRVDDAGNIYVSDENNYRIQEYTTSSNINRTYTAPSAGNYTAVITDPAGCNVTSNSIPISPIVTPEVFIAGPTTVCEGKLVTFIATPVNGGDTPSYQWQINGQNTRSDSASLIIGQPSNQDVISCTMTSDADCPSLATAGDTLLPITVEAAPTVDTGQVFVIQLGQSRTLTPGVSGDVETFSWTPSAGLSNSSIENPLADPTVTTLYHLQVTAADGCQASAIVTVKVENTHLSLPNAFTPNGDGKNDIFYVLEAPTGDVIKHFSIFNRWGQQVFSVTDAQAGDPGFGWNGYCKGTAAMAGTYVYYIELQDASGNLQSVKGTVILIR